MRSLLFHVPTCKMSNLLDTCNTYSEYIEEAIFVDFQCETVHERDIQRIEVEKIVEIGEYDDKYVITHQKVAIIELNNYFLTHLVILDVLVMKLDTIFSCFIELVGS
jgi:hypothetical protein